MPTEFSLGEAALGEIEAVVNTGTLQLVGVASDAAVPSPTFTIDNCIIELSGIASAEAFGTPGIQTLYPIGIASLEAVGTPGLGEYATYGTVSRL